jgi:hypothetical protein
MYPQETAWLDHPAPLLERRDEFRRVDVLEYVDGDDLIRPTIREGKAVSGREVLDVRSKRIGVDVDIAWRGAAATTNLDAVAADSRSVVEM